MGVKLNASWVHRLFIVLWLLWLALIALPTFGVSVYLRWTDGLKIDAIVIGAIILWLPAMLLAALQYVVLGFANPTRLSGAEPR